jgi:DNA-binding SARP family transcriptional activator
MGRLRLNMLGGFQARLGSGAVLRLRTRHTQALLAYLALPCGRAQPRDKLAALLWGHLAEDEARNRLRQALFTLRRGLNPAQLSCLRADGDALVLEPAGVEVDAVIFEELVREGSPDALERAAILYQGDLLQGLPSQGPHPSAFEEWLGAERERLRELALETLAKLVNVQRAAQSPERALSTALRLLALDPLQEVTHRTAMRLYVQLGRRTSALQQYQACVSALRRELDVEPEEETRQLYRDILRRRPILAATGSAPRTAERPAPASPSDGNVPLIGRELETDRLRAWLATASSGTCQVALLVGEAGAGKSRLVAELVALAADAELRARPLRILLGRCHEGEQILSFGPWIDAFRVGRMLQDGALLEKLEPVWRAELVRLLPELGGPDVPVFSDPPDAPRLFEGVRQLVACLIKRSPVVLILEDLHWADEMSLRMLQFLVHRSSGWPLLLVGTAREEELPDLPLLRQTLVSLEGEPHVERVRVASLSRRATLRLVRALSSATSEPAALERVGDEVWRASEGNPFVVVETMRALQQGVSLVRSRGLPIVERVRRVIARRLDQLSDVARDLAAASAVIGRAFEFSLLQRAASRDEAATADGVEELVRRQVLHGVAGGLDFVHERVRGVVYAALSGPRRHLLHRRVAEAIEALYSHDLDPHLATLGIHYWEGEVWDKAANYLHRAGAQAVNQSAYREAMERLDLARRAIEHLPRTAAALDLAVDVRLELYHALMPLGQPRKIAEYLEEARALAGERDDAVRQGWVWAYTTNCAWLTGEHGRAVDAGEAALAIAASLEHPALGFVGRFYLGQARRFRGEYREAAHLLRQNVATLDGAAPPAGVRLPGIPGGLSKAWLAWSLAELGEFDEGVLRGEEALREAEAANHAFSLADAYRALGCVYALRDDAGAAVDVLERGMTLCMRQELGLWIPSLGAALGYAYLLAGRYDDGAASIEAAVRKAETQGIGAGHALRLAWLAEALLASNRLAEAEEVARRAITLASERGERGHEAWAFRALAEVLATRPGQPAEASYHRALALADALGMAPLTARCRLGLGRTLGRAGAPTEARESLGAASVEFTALGMSRLAQLASRELEALHRTPRCPPPKVQ